MHYHISMRAYNLHGLEATRGKVKGDWIEHRSNKKLKSRYGGYYVRPKKTSTNAHLKSFSQATLPHTREGNVRLAFNAITPFEFNLADERLDRFFHSQLTTHASFKWLRKVGNWNRLTHFQSYNYELAMLKQQDSYKRDWNFWDGTLSTMDPGQTYVINVMEGAHTLQGNAFVPYYQLDPTEFASHQNRFLKVMKEQLKDTLKQQIEIRKDRRAMETDVKVVRDSIRVVQKDVLTKVEKEFKEPVKAAQTTDSILAEIARRIDEELRKNIREIKHSDPPVFMVTVGHLAYNGMVGHAPALDGNGIARKLMRKFYRTRVSNDAIWQRNWDDKFYSPPTPTHYGNVLIEELVSEQNGHRIYIDLKHSSFPIRQWFYDSIADKMDIPPICSHCAANGLSKIHYSITTDEYSYADSRSVQNFYPLSINLYDEEIPIICKLGGIIGVTLEQRVLGSFMNNATGYGKKDSGKKRANEIIDFLDSLRSAGRLEPLLAEIIQEASLSPYNYSSLTSDEAFKILCQDYLSAEPFLQNVFYLVDHSRLGRNAWNHLCIGSDMDGFVNPIDIIPTATQYPYFKNRLRQIIPIYLHQRSGSPDNWKSYFDNTETLDECLNLLFYESLRNFVTKWFRK